MNIIKYPAKEDWKEIVKRPHLDLSQLNTTVEAVLGDVKALRREVRPCPS